MDDLNHERCSHTHTRTHACVCFHRFNIIHEKMSIVRMLTLSTSTANISIEWHFFRLRHTFAPSDFFRFCFAVVTSDIFFHVIFWFLRFSNISHVSFVSLASFIANSHLCLVYTYTHTHISSIRFLFDSL